MPRFCLFWLHFGSHGRTWVPGPAGLRTGWAGGLTGGAGRGARDPSQALLAHPCSGAPGLSSRQNKEQTCSASGFQPRPRPCVRQSGTCGGSSERLTGDREAHLRDCWGFPAASQHLEISANSSVFKFLSRAEVSLSFPFCRNLQLVYLIKHCKRRWRSTLEVIHHRLLLRAAGSRRRRSRRLPRDQGARHWRSGARHTGGDGTRVPTPLGSREAARRGVEGWQPLPATISHRDTCRSSAGTAMPAPAP